LRNATLIVAPVSTAVFADDKPNPTSCRQARVLLRYVRSVACRTACAAVNCVLYAVPRLLRMTAGVDPSDPFTKRIRLPSRTEQEQESRVRQELAPPTEGAPRVYPGQSESPKPRFA
jgi:hypothetical protein